MIEHPGIIEFDPIALELELRKSPCARCGTEKYLLKGCDGCLALDAALCLCGHFGAGHTFWPGLLGKRFDFCEFCTVYTPGLKEPFDRCHLLVPVSEAIMTEIKSIKSDNFLDFIDKLPMKLDTRIANQFYLESEDYKKRLEKHDKSHNHSS